MKSHEHPGTLRRMVGALAGALRRGILGNSCHEYMCHFTAGEAYWDRALAAQLGWPQKQVPPPDARHFDGSGQVGVAARPSIRNTAGLPGQPARVHAPEENGTPFERFDFKENGP